MQKELADSTRYGSRRTQAHDRADPRGDRQIKFHRRVHHQALNRCHSAVRKLPGLRSASEEARTPMATRANRAPRCCAPGRLVIVCRVLAAPPASRLQAVQCERDKLLQRNNIHRVCSAPDEAISAGATGDPPSRYGLVIRTVPPFPSFLVLHAGRPSGQGAGGLPVDSEIPDPST